MPKIGHVHLKVSNLKKAEEYYTKLLGFKISEQVENYSFLTFGKEHHDLALQEIRNAKPPEENSVGLYHFAVELQNFKQLADIYFKLKKHKIQISPVDHGISKSIYIEDPDMNSIEIYVDTRENRKRWGGMSSIIPKEDFLKYLGKKQK